MHSLNLCLFVMLGSARISADKNRSESVQTRNTVSYRTWAGSISGQPGSEGCRVVLEGCEGFRAGK